MSLQDVKVKQSYRSSKDAIPRDFYVPLLSKAISYDRAVGFFSSTVLSKIYTGISNLANNGGKIRIVASPKLSEGDVEAIRQGYKMRDTIMKNVVLRELNEPKTLFEEKCLNQLANLIAQDILDIKIAFTEKNNSVGMYHEKMGLITDRDGNTVAFSGSMNESLTAVSLNYESIDIFCSWKNDQERERVEDKKSAFSSIWNNNEPNIVVIEFPELSEEIIRRYRREKVDRFQDIDEELEELEMSSEFKRCGPVIPANISLRNYQVEAIDEWQKNCFRGIFDMATGTGKTYTALAAIVSLYKAMDNNLAVIIICPYQHLVEQWKDDIVSFGMKPIVCYSASSQRNWRERLKTAVTSFNLGVQNHFCMVSTNATFSIDYVQELIQRLTGNVVIVVDEAHNFGAEHLSTTLQEHIPYRLALSATIDRHGDPEGTQKLYDYFGEKCIEYTLKDAIVNDMLTPYYYHPITVSLNEDELHDYMELTNKIRKNINNEKHGKIQLSEYAKMLLIKRARIVAGASEKVIKLKEVITDYKDDNQILVYCGATTMRDVDYQEGKPQIDEARQIDIVSGMLGNDLNMRVSKFTSEENADERKRIKANFAEGTHLQALVAIRCLDEGVNIPSIRTAFILASSTNPKEYIQRRGRVLRKFPGKKHARIFDFVTLPIPLEDVGNFDSDIIKGVKSLAKREIERMKNFAAIAENPFDSDYVINKIQRQYDIDTENETEEDENYV